MREARPTGLAGSAAQWKDAVDRVVSVIVLLILSPMLAATALAIRADSPGPVFYRQQRVGRDGREFRIFKFRTMVDGAEFMGLKREVSRNDDRITRVGRWLRLTSFDEIPQLLNVARGEMSLVGPRPSGPHHVGRYTLRQRRRLEANPGITGWAQVNGRNSLTWEERIELDIWYIDHWTPWLELRILLRTPLAMADREGIYGVKGVTTDLGEVENLTDAQSH